MNDTVSRVVTTAGGGTHHRLLRGNSLHGNGEREGRERREETLLSVPRRDALSFRTLIKHGM